MGTEPPELGEMHELSSSLHRYRDGGLSEPQSPHLLTKELNLCSTETVCVGDRGITARKMPNNVNAQIQTSEAPDSSHVHQPGDAALGTCASLRSASSLYGVSQPRYTEQSGPAPPGGQRQNPWKGHGDSRQ